MSLGPDEMTGGPAAQEPVHYPMGRIRFGLALTVAGLLVFLIGAQPGLFGADRSPIVGFIQIVVFLVGLAVICLGGYISLTSLWNGNPKTIAADIGLRLVATGLVVAIFSGMADVFGIGSQVSPKIPFFGPWQARGVEVGEAVIGLGLLLMLPFVRKEHPHPDGESSD